MLPLKARRVGGTSFQVLFWTLSLLSLKYGALPTPTPSILGDLTTEAARGSKLTSSSKPALNNAALGRISTKIENGFKPSDQGAHISELRFTADLPEQHLEKSAEIIGNGHVKSVKSFYNPKSESGKVPQTSDVSHNADNSQGLNHASDSDAEDVFYDAPSEFVSDVQPLEQSHEGLVAVKVSTRPDGKVIPDGRSPEGYTRNGIRVTINGGRFQEDGTMSAKSIAAMEKELAKKLGGHSLKGEYLRIMSRKLSNLKKGIKTSPKVESNPPPPPTVTQVMKDEVPLVKTIEGTKNNEIKGFKSQFKAKMRKVIEILKKFSKKILNFFGIYKSKSTKVSPVDEAPKLVDPTPQPPKADQLEDLKERKGPEIDTNPINNKHETDPEIMKKLEQDAAGAAAIQKSSLPQSHFMTELWIDTNKVKAQDRGKVLRENIRKHVPQKVIKQIFKVLRSSPPAN
ncbi:uncharacterized protein MELLADRAFT_78540 [Melampsora larici-populina 98AG31]|uniref:Secreted protein n=1 Tax=Melampsora larici-populina (strain 98AG31 / pathotype 3-4-7) TaxID=747676 RepID=F4RVN1_MELLP|nr:uncharacterized protein MELLADRAFT_78540 [Melampsora larici-populina 98AG31]EGG03385.1 hypothetical protein MELLADRAFT_78540 [Melampsora larici-populina 98AG31]